VVVHGWEESSLVDGQVEDNNHYGERWAGSYLGAGMDYTVVGVHWVPKTGWVDENMTPGSDDAARSVALLLYAFARNYNVSSSRIHMTGFSMGTVVTSKTAKKVQELGLAPLARLTLLDPCPTDQAQVISKTDGDYVEAIHTSSQGICSEQPLAHVDFYVNGGKAQVCGSGSCSCSGGAAVCQPTFFSAGCYHGRPQCAGFFPWITNHMRAPELYLESIDASQGRKKTFLSWKCSLSYDEMIAKDEECPYTESLALVPMGEDALASGRPQDGIYFLKTRGEQPFSYNSYLD